MYRPQQSPTERYGTVALVVALHAGLAAFILANGGVAVVTGEEEPLETFDVTLPPPLEEPEPDPPEPPVVEEVVDPEEALPEEEGEAAPEQVESQATPVVRPDITPPIPVPPSITSATEAGTGSDATQGAGEVDEGGTGAGGQGSGTGAGGSGDGTGGGGTGTGSRPSVIPGTTLTQGDYPRSMRDRWPRGGSVLVAVRVQVDGRATDCKVNRGFGDPEIDAATCRLVEQRVRFEPARDAQGRPYVDWYGYMQRWVGR
ncbi:TonB family protein [Sphingomicrobium sp. XHP0239]|uniref:energy transducer TonB n=1 Tax=Sphingomicrobium maritimum TaxID=3133972 RepID=UPI0031CCCA48